MSALASGVQIAPDTQPAPHPTGGKQLTVLTWHIHGSYLRYLAECGHDFVVPFLPGRPPRFVGRPADAAWPPNVREIPAEEIRRTHFDAVLYQHHTNWLEDRERWLSPDQLEHVPQAFLEHDPPRAHPTDTCHPVDDPDVPIVHCTHFNHLMWDCRRSPSLVIEHGVRVPEDALWSGELARGIVAVNNIASRGRRLGSDVLERFRAEVPLDVIGIGSELVGGRGEVAPSRIAYEYARYRFFLNPIRYTSLGLAVLEAMSVGTPVVGLATTEMAVAVENGVSGFIHTDVERLARSARALIEDPSLAAALSRGARARAHERYGIERFARDWNRFLGDLTLTKGRVLQWT